MKYSIQTYLWTNHGLGLAHHAQGVERCSLRQCGSPLEPLHTNKYSVFSIFGDILYMFLSHILLGGVAFVDGIKDIQRPGIFVNNINEF